MTTTALHNYDLIIVITLAMVFVLARMEFGSSGSALIFILGLLTPTLLTLKEDALRAAFDPWLSVLNWFLCILAAVCLVMATVGFCLSRKQGDADGPHDGGAELLRDFLQKEKKREARYAAIVKARRDTSKETPA